jgi:3-deoxy-D-arabino-heptulosonate 7-phosphate (DAHP) synthase
MARTILYTYKDEDKELLFSKQQHRTIQEAVAAAEGIDITEYLKTEQQLELILDTKAVRNYQDNYFRKLGFTKLTLKQKENLGVGKKNK